MGRSDLTPAKLLPALAMVLGCTAPAAAAATAVDDGGQQLPVITVTAHKVEQSLEEVAASVSAIDGDAIRETAVAGFAELQDYAANVTIALSVSAGQFAIRGFATQDTNAGFDPSVGTVVDGVYYGRSNFLSAFFHDVDRFEVLRGPQGTLFGRNSTAGLLNVVTEAPSAEPEIRGEVLLGDNGSRSLRPVLALPLYDGLAVRLSGNYDHGDPGLLYNTFLNRPERNPTQDTTRLRLRYVSTGDWFADVTGFVSRQQQNFNLFRFTQLTDDMRALVQSYDPLANADIDSLTNSANLPALEDGLIRGVNGTLNLDLPEWRLKDARLSLVVGAAESLMYHRDLDADFSPVPFIHDVLLAPSRFRQNSMELRLSGRAGTLFGMGHGVSFLGGLYWYDATFKTSDLFEVEDLGAAFAYLSAAQGGGTPGGAFGRIGGALGGPLGQALELLDPALSPVIGQQQSAQVALSQHVRDAAVFGQFEHFVTPHWALIGGVRLGRERKVGDMSSLAQGQLVPLIAEQEDHQSHRDRTEDDVSPKGGLKWQPRPEIGAYATWSRGFKSGGFNALPLTSQNLEFEPERATSVELGAKARLLGGTMRMSGALFSTDFENLQVSTFQNNSFVILNAAQARSRGFEVELHWLPPVAGTALQASVGLADARYVSYPDAPAPAAAVEAPLLPVGCGDGTQDLPACASDPTQDLTGQPLAFAPRWTASIVPSYRLPLIGDLGATLALDVLYRDARFLNVDNDPAKLQPATTLLNARVILGGTAHRWSVALAARNLTNELILDQVIDQPLAPGNITAIRTDRGRFYAANLAFAF